MTNKPMKEKKEQRALDPKDFKNKILIIVDQLALIEGAREVIKETQAYLKLEYGLAASDVRATATALFKQNKEELAEKNERVLGLVEICE